MEKNFVFENVGTSSPYLFKFCMALFGCTTASPRAGRKEMIPGSLTK
jgi:hypothetical protein